MVLFWPIVMEKCCHGFQTLCFVNLRYSCLSSNSLGRRGTDTTSFWSQSSSGNISKSDKLRGKLWRVGTTSGKFGVDVYEWRPQSSSAGVPGGGRGTQNRQQVGPDFQPWKCSGLVGIEGDLMKQKGLSCLLWRWFPFLFLLKLTFSFHASNRVPNGVSDRE